MRLVAAAVTILTVSAPFSYGIAADDAEVLALVRRHCVMCHAAQPAHESFREAPKNVILESIADVRKHASTIYAQTVRTRAMPLGNQTGMTDGERVTLGQWLKGQP